MVCLILGLAAHADAFVTLFFGLCWSVIVPPPRSPAGLPSHCSKCNCAWARLPPITLKHSENMTLSLMTWWLLFWLFLFSYHIFFFWCAMRQLFFGGMARDEGGLQLYCRVHAPHFCLCVSVNNRTAMKHSSSKCVRAKKVYFAMYGELILSISQIDQPKLH